MDNNLLLSVQPGILIDLSYLTAGMALVGVFQGAILASSIKENRISYILFAILSLFTAGLQIAIAEYHTSMSLAEAIFVQKILNTIVLLMIPVLFGWVSIYTQKKYYKVMTFLISVFCLVVLVLNLQSQYGLRFGEITSFELLEFSWNESLVVIRGEPGVLLIPTRIIATLVFGWIMFCGYKLLKAGNWLSGYSFLFGGLVWIIVAQISQRIDHDNLNFIYIGGYGFLIFIAFISVIMAREFQQSRDRVNTLEFYDALTLLPNRDLFVDMIENELNEVKYTHQYFSVLLLDIDRFKSLISVKGHKFGDELLVCFAKRLQEKLGQNGILARLTADQFAILMHEKEDTRANANNKSYALAEKLQNELRESCFIGSGDAISLSFSIGIVTTAYDNDSPDDLLKNVDAALQRSRQAGGRKIEFFDSGIGDDIAQRFQLESELRRSVEQKELRLYLQPQVNNTGLIVGSEALIRWQHPEKGLVPPGVFIPLAEESDLIIEISHWVFDQVCRILAHENVTGNPISISVNVSPRHFGEKNFVSWVKQVVEKYGTDPSQLVLEITEGLMIIDVNDVVMKMNALNDIGIQFSIDDFGTGYSSLSYLKKLPIHEIKVDKSFVQEAPYNNKDEALIKTMYSIATNMKLKIVAEGVESKEQSKLLNEIGSFIHQGYLYGKPEPYENWVRRWKEKLI